VSRSCRVLSMWNPDIAPEVYDALRGLADVDMRAPDRGWLLEHIGEYDVYLASLKVRVDRAIAERAAAGRLKLVYTPSTGLDHIDCDALAEHGIEMRSLRSDYALLDRVTSTAELAFALVLAVARKIPNAHAAAMRGHWARDAYCGRQLAGKTLGVLGVGRLGRMMVDYGRGFRMRVIGCDPAPLRPVPGLDYLDYPAFAAQADVISLHMHLTPETRRYLNAARLARMKPGAILVNTSRGGIIDEDALLDALSRGALGGFGADVIDGEWRDDLAQHPLIAYARQHDNVVILPHVGGVTLEAQTLTHRTVCERVAEWLGA
jgi:D-3-phosphoglycerate dehydrogenase / 2-oxoglutarate reductase